MKNKLLLLAGFALAFPLFAQADLDPLQKFRITVRDVGSKPMEGVPCKAYFHPNTPGVQSMDTKMETGKTDGAGTVELSSKTIWFRTSISADLDGYYRSHVGDF